MQCEFEEDYSSDGDEDYQPSDEASEAESEDSEKEDDGGVKGQDKPKRGSKRRQRKQGAEVARSRTGGISLPEDKDEVKADGTGEEEESEEPPGLLSEELAKVAQAKKEEAAKKKADDLWNSFLEDVGPRPKAKSASTANTSSSSKKASTDEPSAAQKALAPETNGRDASKSDKASSASKKTVTVTKVFDFAGEEVRVTEEVPASSKEAKRLLSTDDKPSHKPGTSAIPGPKPPTQQSSLQGAKRAGGGLSSVLNMINKKPKMSVLEKSRLDWTSFTSREGITEDLKLHNKGKEGYIEKQKFLQEADRRQYEKERDVRMGLGKR